MENRTYSSRSCDKTVYTCKKYCIIVLKCNQFGISLIINTPVMFGKFYRKVVKQRRDFNVILLAFTASATIYGMLLASG